MAAPNSPSTDASELPLAAFELPNWQVEPVVRSCRLFNIALDFVFDDVPTLRAALAAAMQVAAASEERPGGGS